MTDPALTPNPSVQPPTMPEEQQSSSNPYHTPAAAVEPNAPTVAPTAIGDNAGVRMLLPVGRSGWAIAAGYLGLFSLILLPAPLAVIISAIAIWDIKRSKAKGKQKHGLGRAIFGLIAGILGTILLIGLLVAPLIKGS